MSYEAWRISYQSSEQAARAAYKEISELQKQRERLLVLATKHCPKDHHDWQEILEIAKKLGV